MSTTTLSPLRQRMIEDMSLRDLAPGTQQAYIRGCRKLAAFLDLPGFSGEPFAPAVSLPRASPRRPPG